MTTLRRLTDADLAALADLERRVVAVDGGRLKLEPHVLRDGAADGLLTYDGERLVGFLGVYAFGGPPELAGAVDPQARRHGVGGALLDAALQECRQRGTDAPLLVVPAGSASGEALARSRGGTHAHSEHALVLTVPPQSAEDPRTALRPARPDDTPAVARVLEAAFGHPLGDVEPGTVVVEHAGEVVGTLRVDRHGDRAGVYGFAVDPSRQGQGIGRDVLGRVCRQQLASGATSVALEVAVDNPHALRLYTSTGFVPVAGEDYWSLPLA
ncbi:MAG: GCN5-related N-acetyltransferase [Frankiales bacterium]|nr:GCN5-related N-acetyltransferase [Frankiales bacterium]